jgi:hypothetical protein
MPVEARKSLPIPAGPLLLLDEEQQFAGEPETRCSPKCC